LIGAISTSGKGFSTSERLQSCLPVAILGKLHTGAEQFEGKREWRTIRFKQRKQADFEVIGKI
jgi:hypothetical protein